MSVIRGYVANTDFEWYRYLLSQPPLDEVNFWKPSEAPIRPDPGTPFFFRLKSPHQAIAGFGYFARYALIPLSLAWESFQQKNGAPDFETMRRQIGRYHRGAPAGAADDYLIGCIMISTPVFFEEASWVREPADWPRHVPPGMYYDLSQGEGLRIWEDCRARVAAQVAEPAVVAEANRYGAPQVARPRLGQGTFRIAVADAYGGACAVTTEHSLPALEAAHIRRYSQGGEHAVSNGILLRADLHRLFDKGFVTITPEHRFLVSRRLKEAYRNGRSYDPFHGRKIELPRSVGDRPDPGLLRRHVDTVFLG